jgi:AmmeMemoRadiSam system protein B
MDVDDAAHHGEHSIEVQVPFLQSVSQDREKDLRVVAVMIADDRFEKWGLMIKDAVKELGRKAVVVCSSDFTHYGRNYGYTPFDSHVDENMEKLDGNAINFITKPNPKSFLEYVNNTGATICGKCGIAVLMWLMKNMGEEKKGELLKYYTSADVVGDYSNAVGYAAIVFR